MRLKRCFTELIGLVLIGAPMLGVSQTFRLAAMVANQTIDWNGWKVVINSFDSANPAWSTGGAYDPAKAKDNGDVIVGGSIFDSKGIANANIYGHVQVGSGGGVDIGSLGGIGGRFWQASHPGEIEPGWLAQDNFAAPTDIALPYSSGIMPPPGDIVVTNCINGSNCPVQMNHYDHVIATGDYYATSLSGMTIVIGTARLVLPNGLNMKNSDQITVAMGGSITIYVGTNSTVGGNGIVLQSRLARNFEILGTSNVTAFTINCNGEYIGVLMAPQATVKLNGAGNNLNEFIGALIAGSVKLNGNFNFHFDESLIPAPAQLGPPGWSNGNQLSFSVAGATGFSYIIQTSTNLGNWDSLTTNTSPFTFVDDSATNFLQRYYRAARVP